MWGARDTVQQVKLLPSAPAAPLSIQQLPANAPEEAGSPSFCNSAWPIKKENLKQKCG